MASSLRSFAAALLFVMLFMATEMGRDTKMVAEAKRDCIEKPSGKYKGACGMDLPCIVTCKSENMKGGYCKSAKGGAKCICIVDCI
nr:defensin-like protein P322 [Ipomoea batatas]